MSEQGRVLEQYLQAKFTDKPELSLTRLDKLRDGWESDNYVLTVEYGGIPRTHTDWVWRLYSGADSRAKAVREFNGMTRLFGVGYPVPRVLLLEAERSPFDRPFIVMEYVPGQVMWDLLDIVPADRRAQLIDVFCRLFVRLHALDWRQFDDSWPGDDSLFFVDHWLRQASTILPICPEVDATPFLEWVKTRRVLFACARPSPVHQDFHPGNILVRAHDDATVIDWTGFDVTDSRFDLAWTLVLAHAYGGPGLRDDVLQAYQRHAGLLVEQIEAFEVIQCARRLLDLTVSLTQGAERRGMNAQAAEAMRAAMDAHRRVHHLFVERTGLQIKAFDDLFG